MLKNGLVGVVLGILISSFLISCGVPVIEEFHLGIDEATADTADTAGGYAFDFFGRIPLVGEKNQTRMVSNLKLLKLQLLSSDKSGYYETAS